MQKQKDYDILEQYYISKYNGKYVQIEIDYSEVE